MIRKIAYPDFLYAFGHLLVDMCCAMTMLSLSPEPGFFVLYNFLAFAAQMPIGLLADGLGTNRAFAQAGAVMVLLGMLPLSLVLKILLIGLGNACYHVGGGREALLSHQGMTGLGLFVSPGAAGIFLGSIYADHPVMVFVSALLLVVCVFAITFFCDGRSKFQDRKLPNDKELIIMFSVVLLRSLVGLTMDTPWKAGIYIGAAAIAAAAGKALGGVLADRIGWRISGVASLLISAAVFLLPDSGVAGLIGVFLFQMTMPVTLGQAASHCRGYEGFVFGLLTFGLFLGYLPAAFGITLSPDLCAGISVLSAALLLLSKEAPHD